ncbi:cytochrome c biogenesis protein ResB [Rhodococcus pyridinivorans]|uniref:cytochrome c biogenesis protein ResB n=1 Tax=Rhodococcus pyridinivorans TaxID=103816 RepID=UPI001E37B2F3|nr:cytochrome c biogenesis protein ResB [Rhodococcus pyridinivorans]UGQ56256.1 cytochrome c biogenesis protein ResB [Rhodococcus pyridinivorans]
MRFDGAEEFAYLQVSHDPAQNWVLVFAITMMGGFGLAGDQAPPDLGAAAPAAAAPPSTGGLARTDQAGWGSEFTDLCQRLLPETPSAAKEGR